MQISIASDHAGFDLKNFLVAELQSQGYDVHDHGAHELIPDDDYPLYIAKVATDVSRYEEGKHNGDISTHTVHGEPRGQNDIVGIVIGGSGQGEAMAANKFPFVRAVVVYGGQAVGGSMELISNITRLSRLHNDSNVLSLGARFLSNAEAMKAVEIWLKTEFLPDDKYTRRNDEVESIEAQF
jgi:ribose 5-phosphate isomerase B